MKKKTYPNTFIQKQVLKGIFINCLKCTDVRINFAYLHWNDCTHLLFLVSLFQFNWISKKNTEKKDIVMKMFLLLTLYHVLFLCNLILD